MEKKIRRAIKSLYKKYEVKQDILQEEHILNLCLNDIASHPNIEKMLKSTRTIKIYIMQIILEDVSRNEIKRIV